MKIRTDFVTNSSSSSYIIGRSSDESVNKNSVYQLMRRLYSELEHIREEFDRIIPEADWVSVDKRKNEIESFFIMTTDDRDITIDSSSPDFEALCDIAVRYGVETTSFHMYDDLRLWWKSCETYEEYVQLCDREDSAQMFTITDLAVDDIMYDALDKDTVDHESDTLSHFTDGLVYTAYKTLDMDCNACRLNGGKCERQWRCSQYSEDDFAKLEAYKARIRTEDLPKERACLHFLGRVCIQSFEGDIPYWVSDRLVELSEYSDIHW